MSATQQGVENPRRALLADIVKNRSEQLVSELEQGGASKEDIEAVKAASSTEPTGDDPNRPADVPAEEWSQMSDEDKNNAIASAAAPAGETDPVVEADAAAKAEEERKAAEAAAGKTKIKVDGQEQEVTEAQIREAGIRALQKESAADKRLEEATRTRDEVERLKKTVEEMAARSAAPLAPPKKSDQDLMVAKEGLRDIVKKIQYGSEEEAAEALAEYGNRMASHGQTERLTQSELLNILDLREAQQFVKTNYADVVGDENLKELFVGKVNKKLAAGDGRPYQEICKETGDELRAWKAPAKADPTPAGGSRQEAAERKTRVLSIPAAAGRQAGAPTETKIPTQSELIEKARKARGQQ